MDDTREIAQTYLGNLTENSSLNQRVTSARQTESYLETYLTQDDRGKGRIQARSTSGIALGIIKNRDWSLRSQDVFQTDSGKLLLIHIQEQKLMVLSFTEQKRASATQLVKLGHMLGNQHYPIKIIQGKIYLKAANPALAEKTIEELQIPGLAIDYELRSPNQTLSFSSPHHH